MGGSFLLIFKVLTGKCQNISDTHTRLLAVWRFSVLFHRGVTPRSGGLPKKITKTFLNDLNFLRRLTSDEVLRCHRRWPAFIRHSAYKNSLWLWVFRKWKDAHFCFYLLFDTLRFWLGWAAECLFCPTGGLGVHEAGTNLSGEGCFPRGPAASLFSNTLSRRPHLFMSMADAPKNIKVAPSPEVDHSPHLLPFPSSCPAAMSYLGVKYLLGSMQAWYICCHYQAYREAGMSKVC